MGAALCAAPVAEGGGVFAAFLAANPLVAPVTIGVGGVGLAGYGVWRLISGIKKSKKDKNKENESLQRKGYASVGNPGEQDPDDPKKDIARIVGDKIMDWAEFKKLDRIKKLTRPYIGGDGIKGSLEITGKFHEGELPANARYLSPDRLYRGEVEVWAKDGKHLGGWVIDKATQALRHLKEAKPGRNFFGK